MEMLRELVGSRRGWQGTLDFAALLASQFARPEVIDDPFAIGRDKFAGKHGFSDGQIKRRRERLEKCGVLERQPLPPGQEPKVRWWSKAVGRWMVRSRAIKYRFNAKLELVFRCVNRARAEHEAQRKNEHIRPEPTTTLNKTPSGWMTEGCQDESIPDPPELSPEEKRQRTEDNLRALGAKPLNPQPLEPGEPGEPIPVSVPSYLLETIQMQSKAASPPRPLEGDAARLLGSKFFNHIKGPR
jgi:hypothetical protein